jgi:hypothetical protein
VTFGTEDSQGQTLAKDYFLRWDRHFLALSRSREFTGTDTFPFLSRSFASSPHTGGSSPGGSSPGQTLSRSFPVLSRRHPTPGQTLSRVARMTSDAVWMPSLRYIGGAKVLPRLFAPSNIPQPCIISPGLISVSPPGARGSSILAREPLIKS